MLKAKKCTCGANGIIKINYFISQTPEFFVICENCHKMTGAVFYSENAAVTEWNRMIDGEEKYGNDKEKEKHDGI